MKRLSNHLFSLFIASSLLLPVPLAAHENAAQMAQISRELIQSFTPEQSALACFPFNDPERLNWHFIPRVRKGLILKNFTSSQKILLLSLLQSALSVSGASQAQHIMDFEDIVFQLESSIIPPSETTKIQAIREKRDPQKYFLSFFGSPSDSTTWAWRWEGHHLSVNITIQNCKILSVTPLFMGANPAEVRSGSHEGLRILGKEEDLARQLLTSFSSTQSQQALYDPTPPKEMVSEALTAVSPLSPQGISRSHLSAEQQSLLDSIILLYLNRLHPKIASTYINKCSESTAIYFAWAGSSLIREGHYYRIQTPDFLIEFNNTQNNANHCHSVFREFKGDFAQQTLSEHLIDHSK
jgi:hypothetical protein